MKAPLGPAVTTVPPKVSSECQRAHLRPVSQMPQCTEKGREAAAQDAKGADHSAGLDMVLIQKLGSAASGPPGSPELWSWKVLLMLVISFVGMSTSWFRLVFERALLGSRASGGR